MRAGYGVVAGLIVTFALPARAEKLIAVLPLDVRDTDGRMVKAARVSLEEMLRDAAAEALGPAGWTVLTNENQLQILVDNQIDPAKCSDQQCHLATARELKAALFISGAVQWFDGSFMASIRLLDTKNGRIVASEHLSGATAKELCDQLDSKAVAFFSKSTLPGSDAPIRRPVQAGVASTVAPPRTRGALLVDIQRLERLFSTTPRKSPDSVTVIRRLAETYGELERLMLGERTRLQAERESVRTSDPTLAGQRAKEIEKAGDVAAAAHVQAARYARLLPPGAGR